MHASQDTPRTPTSHSSSITLPVFYKIMVNCDGVSYFDAVWAFLNIFAYRFRLTSGD